MTKKIVSVVLLIVLCFCFSSCGNKPKGIYYSGDKASGTYVKYDFDGSKIAIETYIDGKKKDTASILGKYKIDNNQITITYKNEKGEEAAVTKYFEMIDEKSIKIDSFICYSES